ncbi:MAG: hypothetical protein ACLSVO_02990 [Alistipes sp.]|jgi:hypothetical protein|uniref:hypothetical protein n=1 Tax=Alistipes sp. TaxID=1872444 RepID=UPI00399255D5
MANGVKIGCSAQGADYPTYNPRNGFKSINYSHEPLADSETLCIFVFGKRTVQSTQNILQPHYSGVPGAVPFFGTVRLPKHKGASLFLFTYQTPFVTYGKR